MRYVSLTPVLLVAPLALSCGQRSEAPGDGARGKDAPVTVAPRGKVLEAADNEGPQAKKAAFGSKPAMAGTHVDIPGGKFTAGSTPGDRGRDPSLEPALLQVELGPFSIDRYPYPNDPAKPPATGVSRSRASEMCQAAGGRLCTELEWERACKGTEGTAYSGNASWDTACAQSSTKCESGFGVAGMGATIREWTASDVTLSEGAGNKLAAVRGARADAIDVDHRCAHRGAIETAGEHGDVGFRCCHGAPNAAVVPVPQWHQTFRKAELSSQEVGEMFASVPDLKALGTEIAFFKEPEDLGTVLSRGDAGLNTVPNTTFTTQPVLWSPVPGEEILVITGRAQKNAFIVAFHRLPDSRYRLASSFVLKDEKGAIAFGMNSYVRRRMTWSLCWDCRGESGFVSYREDNRVVITQK